MTAAPARDADRKLVASFVAAVEGLSDREVERESGVSRGRVGAMRTGDWLYLNDSTRQKMASYLRHSSWRAKTLALAEQLKEAAWNGDREAAREVSYHIGVALS